MSFTTADLCDDFVADVQVAEPLLRAFGGLPRLAGPIATLRVFEDNSLVRAALETPGEGRVLVVDGGASLRCALLGDQLAALALANAWAGVIVNGCIRDSAAIAAMPLAVRALATHPKKSLKRGAGERDVAVEFAGVRFAPGAFAFADEDGLIVAERDLRRPMA